MALRSMFHFRLNVSGEALDALEARDADFSRENDALRLDNHDLLHRSRWLEEELNKQTFMRRNMEDDIKSLAEKERWLQGRIWGLEADVLNLVRAKKDELDRVSKEKAVLEAKLQEAGNQLAKHQDLVRTVDVMEKEIGDFEYALGRVKLEENDEISSDRKRAEKQRRTVTASEVLERMQVLERENKELQAEVCNVKRREKSDAIRRISNKKMAVEAEKRKFEEKEKMEIQELIRRVQVLEKEKGEIEAELSKTKSQKSSEIEMIVSEKMALETKIRRMEGEGKLLKRDMEAELRKTKTASTEFERILSEKTAVEVQNKKTEEEMKEKISQLANKNEVLEMEKGEIEAQLCQTLHEKVALGGYKSIMETELKEKISELVDRIERIMKEKTALEVEKKAAEMRVSVLERGLKDSKLANKLKQQLFKKISKEKTSLEVEISEMRKVEEESDEKISDLVKRTEVLVREKEDMEAELCKAKKDKKNGSERISKLKEAVEDQRSRMEEAEKQVSEILKAMGDLERVKEALEAKDREKITMEDEQKKVLVLFQITEVLKTKKIEMEARFCQENMKKNKVIKRMLNKKMALEAAKRTMEGEEKKVSELVQITEVLKREKTEMEAKFCQESKEKSDAIKRISKEKMGLEATKRTMEDEHKKKVSDLSQNIEALKREKREIEAKFCQTNKEKSEEIRRMLTEKRTMEDDHKKVSDLLQSTSVEEGEEGNRGQVLSNKQGEE